MKTARRRAMQSGAAPPAGDGTSRERCAVGADVIAPDALPSERRVQGGAWRAAGQPGKRIAAAHGRQMDCAVYADAMATRDPDAPGDRSVLRWHPAGRLSCRRIAGCDTHRSDRRTTGGWRVAGTPDFWQDVVWRVAPVGVPAHRSSPAPVRRLRSGGRADDVSCTDAGGRASRWMRCTRRLHSSLPS